MIREVVFTVDEKQWDVIRRGLGKLIMDDALPVLQALQAQIDEQCAAHELLSRAPAKDAT